MSSRSVQQSAIGLTALGRLPGCTAYAFLVYSAATGVWPLCHCRRRCPRIWQSANTIEAQLIAGGTETLKTKNVIIATGSEVTPLPPCPVDNAGGRIVDSTGALALTSVPKHLVVIGAGVIGLEMGSVWRRLGAKVTVVEFLDRITPGVRHRMPVLDDAALAASCAAVAKRPCGYFRVFFSFLSGSCALVRQIDNEIAAAFKDLLTKQGMAFKMGTKVTASKVAGDSVTLTVEPSKGGAAESIDADVVRHNCGTVSRVPAMECDE